MNEKEILAGKYVLYRQKHFMGFRVFEDGTCRLQRSHKTHDGTECILTQFNFNAYERIFEIRPVGNPTGYESDIGFDVSGSSVRFTSVLSGDVLLPACDVRDIDVEECFLTLARRLCRNHIGEHPPFAISLVCKDDVVAPGLSWRELGCPLELGIVLRHITGDFASALLDAIRAWSPTGVQCLLENGQDPNQIYCDGRSALHCALERGALSCVCVLLEGAADPNLTTHWRMTPLRQCVAEHDFHAVQILLQHGADANLQDCHGNSPLHSLADSGLENNDLLELLLRHGANAALQNHAGASFASMVAEGQLSANMFTQDVARVLSGDVLLADCASEPSAACQLFDVRGGSSQTSRYETNTAEPVLTKSLTQWLQLCRRVEGASLHTEDVQGGASSSHEAWGMQGGCMLHA